MDSILKNTGCEYVICFAARLCEDPSQYARLPSTPASRSQVSFQSLCPGSPPLRNEEDMYAWKNMSPILAIQGKELKLRPPRPNVGLNRQNAALPEKEFKTGWPSQTFLPRPDICANAIEDATPNLRSRDKLLRTLRAMYPGEATELIIRQIEKMSRSNEDNFREIRVNKDDSVYGQISVSGDLVRKRQVAEHGDMLASDEIPAKRTRFDTIIITSQPALSSDLQDNMDRAC